VELRIPKLRVGSFYPSLLEPRRRVDKALWAVIMTACITGTSTRKVDDLVRGLGCDSGVSRSTVSRIRVGIDGEIAEFRTRPLGHIAMLYVYLDATHIKAGVAHRIGSRAVVVATAVTADGNREVLGLDVGDSEDEVFWTTFLRSLRDPGPHRGAPRDLRRLRQPEGRDRPGVRWRRVAALQVHTMRNILATVPQASKEMVVATVRTIFAQATPAETSAQLR
jgi:putative transposase